MESTLTLDVAQADKIGRALAPSLRDSDTVQYRFAADDQLQITISAEGLGPLRGATNTALMLTKLSNNVMTFED
jgi:tRNA threonylcarbamoyladenosine modification (KEOPS) complex  Pcc1 subunit